VVEKAKTKRQLIDDARQAALDSQWSTAIDLNRQFIERFPRDAEAHNRLGRAFTEFKRYGAAYEEYTAALRIDPANMIARRNLQRLEHLRHLPDPVIVDGAGGEVGGEPRAASIPRMTVFIEEVGKTWIDELVNPINGEDLAKVLSGEQLELAIEDNRLVVLRRDGQRLGEVEARTAERVVELMREGNRYEAYALGLSATSLRVILREVYRNPSQAGKVSFPRQIKATRAYMRERDLLRTRDEADFLLLEDDELLEDEEESAPDTGDDDDAAEPEAVSFIEEAVAADDEDSTI
jgi:tetratricopeptide (TPR) repeat protein